jgi:hypothetical protein
LTILAMMLALLILFSLSDAAISTADTGAPDKEATSSVSKASNSSAGATISITMTGILNE